MRSLNSEISLISALLREWVSPTLLSVFAWRDTIDDAEDSAKILYGGKAHFFGGAGHLDNRFLQESVSRFQLTFLW